MGVMISNTSQVCSRFNVNNETLANVSARFWIGKLFQQNRQIIIILFSRTGSAVIIKAKRTKSRRSDKREIIWKELLSTNFSKRVHLIIIRDY